MMQILGEVELTMKLGKLLVEVKADDAESGVESRL
jgi:hypothetical protein